MILLGVRFISINGYDYKYEDSLKTVEYWYVDTNRTSLHLRTDYEFDEAGRLASKECYEFGTSSPSKGALIHTQEYECFTKNEIKSTSFTEYEQLYRCPKLRKSFYACTKSTYDEKGKAIKLTTWKVEYHPSELIKSSQEYYEDGTIGGKTIYEYTYY